MLVNNTAVHSLTPGDKTEIEILFTDPRSNDIYKDFTAIEGKLLHLVILKQDISVYKIVFPIFDVTTGKFSITLNAANADPDNFNTVDTITVAGDYKLMMQVNITGLGKRSQMSDLTAIGTNDFMPLDLDPIDSDFSITKYFNSAENTQSPEFKGKLVIKTLSGCSDVFVDITLELHKLNMDGSYDALTGIQAWPTSKVLAVWVSEGIVNLGETNFNQIFGDLPAANDNKVQYKFLDNEKMNPGKQKIWFQMKHDGKRLTFPFTFEYYPPSFNSAQCK